MRLQALFLASLLLSPSTFLAAPAAARDVPFPQDRSVRFTLSAELDGAAFRKLLIQRDGIVYVFTDRGVARLFDQTLALDRSFRPLAALRPRDLALRSGEAVYLLEDRFLANAWAGKVQEKLPVGRFQKFAVAEDGAALLLGGTNFAVHRDGNLIALNPPSTGAEFRPYAWRNDLFLASDRQVYRWRGDGWESFHQGTNITALGFGQDELIVGTIGVGMAG